MAANADPEKKRKSATQASSRNQQNPKKPRLSRPQPHGSLSEPHEAILSELAPRYDTLTASVISSTQITKRVTYVTSHLLASSEKPRLVLLHARTTDVCKLISVVERCKRVLEEEKMPFYQYNQLFTSPSEQTRRDAVDQTVLGQAGEDGDSDDFEVMESRLEKAVIPKPSDRVCKSMRVFLATSSIPELKAKSDVTLQTNVDTRS